MKWGRAPYVRAARALEFGVLNSGAAGNISTDGHPLTHVDGSSASQRITKSGSATLIPAPVFGFRSQRAWSERSTRLVQTQCWRPRGVGRTSVQLSRVARDEPRELLVALDLGQVRRGVVAL
eukprot:scaffold65022_cov57-Phaeocystis_antarctica.AAC.2